MDSKQLMTQAKKKHSIRIRNLPFMVSAAYNATHINAGNLLLKSSDMPAIASNKVHFDGTGNCRC